MASEMFKQVTRVLTKDAYVKPESIQVLIDLARESAKVTKPVSVSEVVDYSFLDKARKELGIAKECREKKTMMTLMGLGRRQLKS
jgi:predicted translin family RNA/ssDNA-binding protein